MTLSDEHPLASLGAAGGLLARVLESGRLSPSYLFEGADPEALEEAALAFAAGILTGSPPASPDPREIARVRAGHHPDLQRLGKDKPTVISVAALTPMLQRAHMTPIEGSRQVIVIDPADAMEAEGLARYLKALEEPPEGTVFLLLSSRADRLPETVLSRCRRVRFPPMPETVVRARLESEDVEGAEAAWAARCAGGSLARARRIVDADLHASARSLCTAGLSDEAVVSPAVDEAFASLQRTAKVRAAADVSESDTGRQHVRVLLGDLLYALCVEARERAADRRSALIAAVDPDAALRLLASWGHVAAAIASNVTPAVLLLETVMALRREGTGARGASEPTVR